MSYYKFNENDIFYNVIKAHPKYRMQLYFNNIYINNRLAEGHVPAGAASLYEINVGSASIEASEAGWADKFASDGSGRKAGRFERRGFRAQGIIKKNEPHPVHKNGIISYTATRDMIWKTHATSSKDYIGAAAGTDFILDYPLTASVQRDLVASGTITPGNIAGVKFIHKTTNHDGVFRLMSLRNRYNHYSMLSKYFDFDKYILISGGLPNASIRDPKSNKLAVENSDGTWKNSVKPFPRDGRYRADKTSGVTDALLQFCTGSLPVNQYTNLIAIPKIFYGSAIKKGSVNLEFYFTGTLLARAQDINKNGELIETYGSGSTAEPTRGWPQDAKRVVGTVMYNEGILILTASHVLNHHVQDGYLSPTGNVEADTPQVDLRPTAKGQARQRETYVDNPRWSHFGSYKTWATSAVDSNSASYAPASSSYVLEFRGTSKIPTVTMMAHANKNELNWSNNPTFIERQSVFNNQTYEQIFVELSSSQAYRENKKILIKNTVSSSFANHSASFKPQTFISKIGIYDENKELIAVAKLANPVRKTNGQDYTFKLKLDL